MPRIIIWQVTGMTCRSCEKLIEDVLYDVPGVMEVEVSVKKEQAAVRLRDEAHEPDLGLLNKQLEAHGYRLYPKGCAVPGPHRTFVARLRRALGAIVLVGAALFLLSPLRSAIPSVSSGASVGALIILGVVASVSSCLASTGGFMLAYSAEATSRKKTIFMHIGRLVAFTLGGAILGVLGGSLPTGSAIWYGILGLLLGVGFLGVALNLLELSPSMAKLGLALPSSLQTRAQRIRQRPGSITPFFVGAVTFVLPCGFTQTAQALALASGSWQNGMMYMLAFALGTLPILLGVTTFATSATLKHSSLRLGVGAVLFFFALGQIQGGLAVLGVVSPFSPIVRAVSTPTSEIDGEQIVRMDVRSSGYLPETFTVVRGKPVRWIINGAEIAGCNGVIVSRPLGISQTLNSGVNIITFTPTQIGTIPFSCPMGMYRGSFNVVDKI